MKSPQRRHILFFKEPGGISLLAWTGLPTGWEWEGSKTRDESQGRFRLWKGRWEGLRRSQGMEEAYIEIQLIPLGLGNVTGARQRHVRRLLQSGFPQDLLEQRIPGGSRAGRRSLQQAPACRDRESNCWVQP